MKKEVTVYKEVYFIKRYDKEDDAIKITKDQYEGLEKVLLDTNAKFVKIGDQIIATSSIKEVIKQAERPVDIFEENGSNKFYREWCMLRKPKDSFMHWVDKTILIK